MSRKVKFLADVKVADHNGEIEFAAVAGEVCNLADRSADRWVRRGKAEDAKKGARVGKAKSRAKDAEDAEQASGDEEEHAEAATESGEDGTK